MLLGGGEGAGFGCITLVPTPTNQLQRPSVLSVSCCGKNATGSQPADRRLSKIINTVREQLLRSTKSRSSPPTKTSSHRTEEELLYIAYYSRYSRYSTSTYERTIKQPIEKDILYCTVLYQVVHKINVSRTRSCEKWM
jgi:hypothetical protein